MTEPVAPAPAAPAKKKEKAKLDFNRSYGYITGNYPDCPKARLCQDGKFFDLRGNQVGEVPDQTPED